jgi:chromosome segregation ATPase
MPPLTAEFIVAILALILGGGVSALITLRKLKPELSNLQAEANRLRAEAKKIEAEAEKARSERDAAEASAMKSITDAVHNIVDPLNDEIKLLRSGREEDRKRIRSLEETAGLQGTKLVEKDCQIIALQGQVKRLEDELDAWKSGKKKRTGPLPSGDA